ncbi:MAG: hypothetical protein AAF715_05905 [Myxococcota bacterium]
MMKLRTSFFPSSFGPSRRKRLDGDPAAAPRPASSGAWRRIVGPTVAAGMVVGLTGCPDPQGQFDAFGERTDVIGPIQMGDLCVGQVPTTMESGDYFFSLLPSISMAPAPFTAEVQTDGSEVTIELTAISAVDRTTVVTETDQGDPVPVQTFGPFAIEDDGTTTLELVDALVPGDTNPISPNNLTVQATLTAAFCRDEPGILCGTFVANVTAPLTLDLDGTFAFQRLDGGTIPEPPVVDCEGTTAMPL